MRSGDTMKALHEETEVEGDVDDDYLARFSEETSSRSILLYQFTNGYVFILISSILIVNAMIWLEAIHALVSQNERNLRGDPGITYMVYLLDFIYLIDIFFRISYALTNWPNKKLSFEPAPAECIFIDILSVAPIDAAYYSLKNDLQTACLLRLRVSLRMYRILTAYSHVNQAHLIRSIIGKVIWKQTISVLFLIILVGAHYYLSCGKNKCQYRDYNLYMMVFLDGLKMFISYGADFDALGFRHIYHLYAFISILYYLIHTIGAAQLLCKQIDQIKSKYLFIEEYTVIMINYNQMKQKLRKQWGLRDEMIYYTIKDYFYYFWRQRGGLQASHVLHKILPPSLTNAIIVDMAYDGLKHSHIFRNLPANLLRHICSLVSFEFAVPGEVIIKKGECVNMMVYISHGVLQILSSEDCETPVLNLSGGSNLGESTLFISYPSSCSVLCQTYCELVILRKSSLIESIKYYPEEFRSLVHHICQRFDKAKDLYKLARQKMGPLEIRDELSVMSWIQKFQSTAFLEDNDNDNVENNSRIKGLDYYIENGIFFVRYLDRLVVSPTFELVRDAVFLKSSFHFILQPDSPFLIFWNVIVIGLTFIYFVIYPYNLCFPQNHRSIQAVYAFFITTVYWIDIYLQLSTAIKTRGITYRTLHTIFFYRIKRLNFVLDILAVLPFEFIAWYVSGSVNDDNYMLLQANRLLKYYKFTNFFRDINIWSARWLTFLYHIKWFIHGLFLYYYATVLIYLTNCYDSKCTNAFDQLFKKFKVKTDMERLLATIPLSNALVAGVNLGKFPPPENAASQIVYLLIPIISRIYSIFYIIVLISATAVQDIHLLKEQESLFGIRRVLENLELNKQHQKGVRQYLDMLFYFRCRTMKYFTKTVLSPNLEEAYKGIYLSRLLASNSFFKGMPSETLSWFAPRITNVMVPAGLIIYHCGETIEEFYVIQAGYCTVTYGILSKEVTVNENLGLVESILNIPMFHTITTCTDCLLLKIKKRDLNRFFGVHQEEHEIVKKSLAEFAQKHHLLSRIIQFRVYHKDHDCLKEGEIKSRKCWDRIKSIRTGGNFLFYWELTNTVLVILDLAILPFARNFEPPLHESSVHVHTEYVMGYVNYILDAFYFIDIVIRSLVTYYDEHGIEIRSVTKTIPHYLTRSFILDLIGVVNLEYFLEKPLVFRRFNRLIHFYRIFGFFHHFTYRIRKVRHLRLFTFLLVVITITGYGSWAFGYYTCRHSADRYQCREDSWLTLSKFDTRTEANLYSEIYLLHISIFFTIGFKKFVIQNFYERLGLSVWGILGHLIMMPLSCWCAAQVLFKNADLTIYQQAMRDLVTFMSYCEIDKVVKYEVIQYFEHIWLKREGKNLIEVISPFPTSLQKDLLFSFYGSALTAKGSIFENVENNFLKELLLFVKQTTIRNTGIIYKVNDILDEMYFLINGCIEVVGPDVNVLTVLGPGSLFGCLDNCHRSRQTLTMVANGHVEMLSISSDTFYRLLVKNLDFQRHYKHLTKFNVDYIVCKADLGQENDEPESATEQPQQIKSKRFYSRVIRPRKYLHYFKVFLYTLEFFYGVAFELILQLVHITVPYLIFAYARDFLWVIRMYLKSHLAIEDEYGKLVFDIKIVMKTYTKQKFGFYFDLLCILPIDLIFCFIIPNRALFLLFRANRFLRVFYLFRYMASMTNKLNINVLLIGSINNLLYVYIYIALKFFFFYLCDTRWSDAEKLTNTERLHHAARFLDTVLVISSGASVPFRDNLRNYSALLLAAFMCMDSIFWMIFMANFASTFQVVNQVRSEYRQHCLNLITLMGVCDATKPYIESIDRYTNLFLSIRNGVHFPFLLEEAPYYLREAVLDSMFGFHLRNHYIFKHCHVDFLRQLAATMRVLTYFEGNHVCDMGDIDDTMYFIQEGTVQALTKDTLYTEVCEHLLVAGDSFGLNQILYPRLGHCYAYRASMLTILVTVKRHEFLRLLSFFPSAEKHIYQCLEVMKGEDGTSHSHHLLMFN